MKKFILLLLVVLVWTMDVNAQACDPDTAYIGMGVGVYPLPDTTNGENETLGINVDACKGESYEFIFTAVVPDTIEYLGFPVILDYVRADAAGALTFGNGMDVAQLGFSYECFPANCEFPGGTTGCVRLYSDNVTGDLGDYDIVIATNVKVALSPFEIPANFPPQPGDVFEATLPNGEYVMTIGECATNTSKVSNYFGISQNAPNPFSEETTIQIFSNIGSEATFRVHSLLGDQVYSKPFFMVQGENSIEYSCQDLPNGVYIYSVETSEARIMKKMVVQR